MSESISIFLILALYDRRVSASTSRDVVVVGAGLAGLAAAWHLRDLDVLVLEAGDRVGGRIRSEGRDGVWLNFGAHVFGNPGSAAGRLIDETGVTAGPGPRGPRPRPLPGRGGPPRPLAAGPAWPAPPPRCRRPPLRS